jgi:hypothetical protein
LDFHFIWHCFTGIKRVKTRFIDGLKCFAVKEGIVGDETYGKMFDSEKKELDVVVKDLEEWMTSNIKYQEVDQLLDNQFETKHRRLQNKWLIGMNKRKKLHSYGN